MTLQGEPESPTAGRGSINRLIKIKEDDKKRGIGDDGYYRYSVTSTKE